MDLYSDGGLKLSDMIESDLSCFPLSKGIKDYDFDYINSFDYSPGSKSLSPFSTEPLESAFDIVDIEKTSGWINGGSHFMSSDFEGMDGILFVNPKNCLPVSLGESQIRSSALSLNSPMDSSVKSESVDISTPGTVTVTLPIQVITTTDSSISVSVPTPSPSPHNSTMQNFAEESAKLQREPSPKPKSKSRSKSGQHTSNSNHIVIETSYSGYPKPAYSYSCLIAMALKNSKTGSLPVNEIYDFMTQNFPYFKTAPNGWKNSVRHNLSLNKCFEKIEKPSGNSSQRKGYLWAMNPEKVSKMEEELQKWASKDPAAIRKSMANPERLELIEKGELRSNAKPDSETDFDELNTSSMDEEEAPVEAIPVVEKAKVQRTPALGNDLINNNFGPIAESDNMDACIPDFDLQKNIWDNLCEDRFNFLNEDSPESSASDERMDDFQPTENPIPSQNVSYVLTQKMDFNVAS